MPGLDLNFQIWKAKNVGDGSIHNGGICVPNDGTDGSAPAWDGTRLLLRPVRNINGTAFFDGSDGSDGTYNPDGSSEGSTHVLDRVGHLVWINVSGYTIGAGDGSADGTEMSVMCAVGSPMYLDGTKSLAPKVGRNYGYLEGTQKLIKTPGPFVCHARIDGSHGIFTHESVHPYVGRLAKVKAKSRISGLANLQLIHVDSDGSSVEDGTTFTVKYAKI
jgi:hypothetical protein